MAFQATQRFSPTYYDSSPGLHWLLIEHYGMPDQIVPVQREALRLCGSTVLTVEEAMRQVDLPHRHRALDLGCAVGAGVFKLRRYFDHVVGIDLSNSQLAQARALQRARATSVTWTEAGFEPRTCLVRLADDVMTGGIEFREADIYALPADLGVFDLVIMNKVLECLPDPERCMGQMPGLVAPGGYFVHVSSYRWSPEFTPPEKQLGTPARAQAQLDELLSPHFTLERRFKVPFMIESDPTWFCYGVAEALLWKRR
ncbi:MAG: class I SAM-dependent methyltransferase [Methylacidiphilales bacterium]|nr:class I SAM-dependent methyltransferase [Candidatus Methylacidiphilales bacterium]